MRRTRLQNRGGAESEARARPSLPQVGLQHLGVEPHLRAVAEAWVGDGGRLDAWMPGRPLAVLKGMRG